jgi:hypothetical protein
LELLWRVASVFGLQKFGAPVPPGRTIASFIALERGRDQKKEVSLEFFHSISTFQKTLEVDVSL